MMKLKNNLGYTLGEIVMTTAIIGSLAAIAIPNYLRIKMNVNMEMVRQQMRILGQNLNELYNQNNPHQFPEDIQNLDGNPAEELAITASLNAIDGMGYTDHLWQTAGSPPSTFVLRRCPGEGLWGIVGVTCYVLTPGGIEAAMPWNGTGLDMIIFDAAIPPGALNGMINYFLAEPTMTPDQRARLIADFLEASAYLLLIRQLQYGASGDPSLLDRMPATLFKFIDALSVSSGTNKSTYEALLPQAYQILKDRGVTMVNKTVTVASDGSWNGDPVYSWKDPSSRGLDLSNCGSSCIAQGSYVQAGFEFQDSVKNPAAALAGWWEAAGRYVSDRREYLKK